MRQFSRIAVAGLIFGLAGCASDDTGFYKHAPSVKPLDVPPDLTAPDVRDDFVIPQIGALLSAEPILAGGGKVRLKRDGSLRWLEIQAEPNLVWQQIRDFFQKYDVPLDWENTGLGILETKWVKHYESRFARDKFRVRVEPGSKPGIVEVYLSHRGQQETFGDSETAPVWDARPNDPELEVEVLGQLLVFLGLSDEQRDQLMADAKREKTNVELDIESEIPSITIESDYPRAWKLAVRAADRLGYIVEERDEAGGNLVIRLGKVGVDEGFTPGHGLIGLSREVYRLKLIDEDGESRVEVLTDSGARDNSKTARDFLARMYEKLI